MKVLAIVLLCAFATVQGRSAGVSNTNALATLGENPWIVHLRIAVGTSGFLNSCAGSLIAPTWVLTAADCVDNVRFIWLRYGAVDVIKPSLVLETSTANSRNAFSLISTNRAVEYGSNIGPVSLVNGYVSDVSNFCTFGGDENGPGEQLACFGVEAKEVDEGKLIASSEEGEFTEYDLGAPLVGKGVQVGVLVKAAGSEGKFESIADYKDWIEATTGLKLSPEPESESESESDSESDSSDSSDSDSSDSDSSEEDFKVHIVN